ncbi:acyl-CoA N-acyltransferase [Peziza echinospora]|nr:acyl-CoA N-acyltransferase [Peziza echinospora]
MPPTSSSSTSPAPFTTPFITFIPAGVAPSPSASDPDTKQRTASDPRYPAFRDAMTVREEVFVKEQNVPLENELDEDDRRSFHWVVYASVASSSTSHRQHQHHYPTSGGGGSLTSRIPVGTIRLIPPPHAAHSAGVGSHHHHPDSPPPRDAPQPDPSHGNYIKLGRLATLSNFRGLGIGKLLVQTALNWAVEHADDIRGEPKSTLGGSTSTSKRSSISNTAEETTAAAGGIASVYASPRGSISAGSGARGLGESVGTLLGGRVGWDGKVLVHSQVSAKHVWEKFGFTVDTSMGEWDEEGIMHVGMWKQLQLKKSV